MFTNTPKGEKPTMTLQQLVDDMQEYYAKTGAYRPEDVYRLVGDPRKGIGLSTLGSSEAPGLDAACHAASAAISSNAQT